MKKTTKYLFLLLLATAVFGLSSCKKKWKQPTEVSFKFQLNGNSNAGPVKFTNAYLLLNKVSVSADRKQSPPHVDLQQQLNNLALNFSTTPSSTVFKFDVPQGTYSNFNLKYETSTNQSGYSMLINGTYIDSTGNTLALQFVFSAADVMNLNAKNNSGGNEIVLVEGHPTTATINLNPNYWFAAISSDMLDEADQETINGVQTITIDFDTNDDLYNLIANRIKEGNQCIFN